MLRPDLESELARADAGSKPAGRLTSQSKAPGDDFLLDLSGAAETRRIPEAYKSTSLRTAVPDDGPDAEQDVFRRYATSVNVPGRLPSLGP